MSPHDVHTQEDRLLEYAYDELPAPEAAQVRAHLEACEQCRGALADVQRVRRAVAPLKDAPAPDAGLESLLAYAQKQAAQARPLRRGFTRWALPFAGGVAAAFVAILAARELSLQERAPGADVLVAQSEAPAAPDVVAEPDGVAESAQEPAAPTGYTGGGATFGAPPMMQTAEEAKRAKASRTRAAPRKEAEVAPASAPPPPDATATLEAAPASEGTVISGVMPDEVSADEARAAARMREAAPASSRVAAAVPAAPRASASAASGEAAPESAAAQEDALGQVASPAPAAQARSAVAPDGPRLLAEAREAGRRGDRTTEAQRLHEALAAGLTGEPRLEALLSLCEAELALGARDSARRACEQLVREAPGSKQASAARTHLGR